MSAPIREPSMDMNLATPTGRGRTNSRRLRASHSRSPASRGRRSTNQSPAVTPRQHLNTSSADEGDEVSTPSSRKGRGAPRIASTPRSPPKKWKNSPLFDDVSGSPDVPMSPSKLGLGRRGLQNANKANRGLIKQLLESGPRPPREDSEENLKPTSESSNAATVLAAASRHGRSRQHESKSGHHYEKDNQQWRNNRSNARSRSQTRKDNNEEHSSWRDRSNHQRHRGHRHKDSHLRDELHHSKDAWKAEKKSEIEKASSTMLS